MIPPVEGPITQGWSVKHQAIDIACMPGHEVIAPISGYLNFSKSFNMGITAEIKTAVGRMTISHLGSTSPSREVESGDIISTCGNTGRLSSGPHVHIVWYNTKDLPEEPKCETPQPFGSTQQADTPFLPKKPFCF